MTGERPPLPLSAIDLEVLADLLHQQDHGAGYLDPATGEVIHASYGEVYDAAGETVDLEEVHWISLGGDLGSREAYADMEDFAHAVRDPAQQRRLLRALEGRGAFRRFRDTVYDAPEETGRAWNRYRSLIAELRALRWLSGVAAVDDTELEAAMTDRRAEARAVLDAVAEKTPVPTAPLTWAELVARLAPARTFWLSTTDGSGAPQVAPVWGAVVADTLHVYSERRTAKARNLATNPRVALHLEGAEDVLIVHGTVDDLGLPTSRPDVMDAFRAKYVEPGDAAYLPDADPAFDVLWAVRPSRALTWLMASFEDSRRRWTAQG